MYIYILYIRRPRVSFACDLSLVVHEMCICVYDKCVCVSRTNGRPIGARKSTDCRFATFTS